MTATADVRRIEFDVDAMLMYGWVADADRHITHVSNSLRRWIREHHALKSSNEFLHRILQGGSPVTIKEFLTAILDRQSEAGTPDLVDEYLGKLEERISGQDKHPPRFAQRHGPYKVLLQYQEPRAGEKPLAGARFVRDSATLLASRWNMERVDIIVVAIVEQGAGRWRVVGFQGQLQEAWLRVENKIIDGNRAGGIALMARNLSHNIGSHALFWVAAGMEKRQKEFHRYLQSRMELLAGFATKTPFSPLLSDIGIVVDRFKTQTLLLQSICRTELITQVVIDYKDGNEDGREAAVFFGGEIGIHAFYSILENCIRDSGKHARAAKNDTLTMHVVATPLDDFVQIDVYDDAGNYAVDGPAIAKAIEDIEISDELGDLVPNNWGIKERFVCAAMLRGLRPEDIRPMENGEPGQKVFGQYGLKGKRILEIVDVGGNCGWRFYLPRNRQDLLIVTDRELTRRDARILSFSKLHGALLSPSEITVPFVVLEHLPEGEETALLEARLPDRTYVAGDTKGSRFLRIDQPLEEVTRTELMRRSVERFGPQDVKLIIGISTYKELPLGTGLDPSIVVVDENDIEPTIKALKKEFPHQKLLVFKRHPLTDNKGPEAHRNFILAARDQGIHYFETYRQTPALDQAIREIQHDPVHNRHRLVEAALTRILIIDERVELELNFGHDGFSREALRLRGISTHGAEFAGHSRQRRPVDLEEIAAWVPDNHIVLLHYTIAEKLCKDKHSGAKSVEHVISRLEEEGAQVIVHSGRMGTLDIPDRTKFLSLTNITAWIDQTHSKLQIVDELFSLRRV